nr:unnamed protein product [Callosobruchus analis]
MQQVIPSASRSFNVMPDLSKSIDSFVGEQCSGATEKKCKTEKCKAMQNYIQISKHQASTYFMWKVALIGSLDLTFSVTNEQSAVGLYSRALSLSYI